MLAKVAIMTIESWSYSLCEGPETEIVMSDKETAHYRFTSPLVGDATVDENYFKRLRGKIMQFDGATGCRITNIGCKVDFYPSVQTREALDRYMTEVVGPWATEHDYFPNHTGDESPIEAGNAFVSQRIFNLNSALTALDEETGTFKEQKFVRQTAILSEKVYAFSRHLISCTWDRYGVAVSYDHMLSDDEVEAHMKTVVDWAANNGFFPLRGEKTPALETGTYIRRENMP